MTELKESKKVVNIEYAEIMLGERLYEVSAAGLKRSEKWRNGLQFEINGILGLLKEQGGVFEKIDLSNLKEIANMGLVELVPVLGEVFARLNLSMTNLGNLIIAYHPALEKDVAYILENATTRQTFAALIEMVKFEYPFGTILSRPSPPGPPEPTTSPSLPSPNGESPPLN